MRESSASHVCLASFGGGGSRGLWGALAESAQIELSYKGHLNAARSSSAKASIGALQSVAMRRSFERAARARCAGVCLHVLSECDIVMSTHTTGGSGFVMQTFERSVVHRAHSLESIFERARTPAAHAAPRGITMRWTARNTGLRGA